MADIQGLASQLRQLRDYYSTQPNGEEGLYRNVAQYANKQGLSADVVNQVIQQAAPNPQMWNTGRVQALLDQYGQTPATQVTPSYGPTDQYGLSGATGAALEGLRTGTGAVNAGLQAAIPYLQRGKAEALDALGNTQGQVSSLFGQGQAGLSPFVQTGQQANQLQAALSGALGPEAQKAAFAQYQESPGVEFARQQSERAITRNAAALGGLGGGNVMDELSRNAVGMYLQDFNNQFARTGQVADRGYSAAGTAAGLRGQEAGLQAGLGQMRAQIPLNVNTQIADLQSAAGNTIGGMNYGTGNTLTGLRYQAGQDLANSVSSTTSALSSLINQQGAGMTDIIGNTTTNLNALYQQASQGDANAMEQLSALLGNISTGGASQVSGLPIIQGQPSNYLGQLGQVAGGIGGLASGLSYGRQPATQSVYQTSGTGISPFSPYNAYDNVNTRNYGGYS